LLEAQISLLPLDSRSMPLTFFDDLPLSHWAITGRWFHRHSINSIMFQDCEAVASRLASPWK